MLSLIKREKDVEAAIPIVPHVKPASKEMSRLAPDGQSMPDLGKQRY